MRYPDSTAWLRSLEADAELPDGFRTAVASLDFIPEEKPDAGSQKMNLAAIRLDEPTSSFAAVFTRNEFPGWPVLAGRGLLDESAVQGVLVNNKIANVGSIDGLAHSLDLARSVQSEFGDSAPWIPSSTGVIGWGLPVPAMKAAMPELKNELSASMMPFARAIMTTDAWPKVRCSRCGDGRIVGTAKGAGMVEPNMATMLSFLVTDIDVPRDAARRILADVSDRTFNRISVDGETSTSDTVLLMSSRRRSYPGDDAFRESLYSCASALAEDVVRNGEGCAHVFRVTVGGASTESEAVSLARSVANAPLTKTAVRGNDPNIGRILQALGAACGRMNRSLDRQALTLEIGGIRIYEKGRFLLDGDTEASLSRYLQAASLPLPTPGWPAHEERIEIGITLGPGGAEASVIASDLSEEYVKINADYRT